MVIVSPVRIRVCSPFQMAELHGWNPWGGYDKPLFEILGWKKTPPAKTKMTRRGAVPGSLECCSNPRRGCEVNSLFGTLAAMFSVDGCSDGPGGWGGWVISPPMNPPCRSIYVGEITRLILTIDLSTSWGSWDLQVFFWPKFTMIFGPCAYIPKRS